MFFYEKNVVFNFEKLLKTWNMIRASLKRKIFAFKKDTDLCLSRILKVYLN